MKFVILYRHEDGRQIEACGDDSHGEVWLIYPHRELLDSVKSMDEAKEKVPEGFVVDDCLFTPPCPKCSEPSSMSLTSGMYLCRECETEF